QRGDVAPRVGRVVIARYLVIHDRPVAVLAAGDVKLIVGPERTLDRIACRRLGRTRLPSGRAASRRGCRRRCWSGRWAWTLDVTLAAASRATGAVAEVLRKDGVALLHSTCGAGVAVSHRAIHHIEATLPLIQPYLVVSRR